MSTREQFQIRMSRFYTDTFHTIANAPEMIISCENAAKLNIGISSTTPNEQTPHLKFDHTNNNKTIHVYGNMVLHNNLTDANGNIIGQGQQSDARLKSEVSPINPTTITIEKLQPVTYNRWNNMEKNDTFTFESGLIAQDIYTNAPELRHLITVSSDSIVSSNGEIENWGSEPATINYVGVIPYLISSIQEINNLTKQKDMLIANLISRVELLEDMLKV
jgi:hypothetical protein